MHHVFVSYSRRDSARVEVLVERLMAAGVRVWIDQTDIPVSVPWMEEIRDAIRAAALVVTVDSEHWFSSEHCVVEERLATAMNKPVLHVDVGSDPAEAVARVRQALRQYGARDRAMTELLVRSCHWDRAGSPRKGLARGRDLGRYLSAARGRRRILPRESLRYLARSGRRQARRWLFAGSTFMVIALVMNMSDLFSESVQGARELIGESHEQGAELALLDEERHRDPTLGLERTVAALAENGAQEGAFLPRLRLIEALAEPLPLLPDAGEPLQGDREGDDLAAPSWGGKVELGPGSDVRVLDEEGRLWRTYQVTGKPAAAAWSSDGRLLAVGVHGGIDLIHVESGATRRLRGVPRQLTDVRWIPGDGRVAGTDGDGRTFEWVVSEGVLLHEDDTLWVMDMTWLPGTRDVVLISRDGRVLRVNSETGESRLVAELPGIAVTLAAFPGRVVVGHAAADERSLSIVDLESGEVSPVSWAECGVRGLAALPDRDLVAVACGGEGVWVVDPDNGEVISRRAMEQPAVAVDALGEALVVGTAEGALQVLTPGASAGERTLWRTCPSAADQIRVWHQGSAVIHAGPSLGTFGCGARGIQLGSAEERFNAIVFPQVAVKSARGLAVSEAQGWAAYGFADGSIWTFDVDELNPRSLRHGVLGEIRGLAYAPDGSALVAVTRDGVVTRFSTDIDRMDMGDLMTLAEARLAALTDPGGTGTAR